MTDLANELKAAKKPYAMISDGKLLVFDSENTETNAHTATLSALIQLCVQLKVPHCDIVKKADRNVQMVVVHDYLVGVKYCKPDEKLPDEHAWYAYDLYHSNVTRDNMMWVLYLHFKIAESLVGQLPLPPGYGAYACRMRDG
jgi:hypothetical protein